MSPRHFLLLTLLSAIWGSSFMFTRLAVNEMGPVALTALRSAIAALTLMPVMLWSGLWPEFRQRWPHIMVIGLISTALPFCLIAISTQYTSAGFASIVNSFTPIFSALIAWLWLKDYLPMPAVLGIGLGCIGVLVMVTDGDTITASLSFLPILAGLGATFLYALTGNYSKRFVQGAPPLAMAAGCQFFAALFLAPGAVLLWPDGQIAGLTWLWIVILGILCTGLAFILYFHLLGHIGVSNTVLVTYLAPVFAMFWGGIFLGETITLKMLLGTAFILGGITLTTGLLKRVLRGRNPRQALEQGTTDE